jgi:peptidoglycan/LPS O-acetylase OafA/YrhL
VGDDIGDVATSAERVAKARDIRKPRNAPSDRRPGGLWAERFDLIDGWRGLAALAVVVHHVTGRILIGGPAVMLFFVISGYCIAASADSCKRRGLGFGTFMMRRVRRIYPPYLLSILFWSVTRAIKWSMTGENELARPFTQWVQNITLTQWLTLLPHPQPSAATNHTLFVAAYWSLCYEEQFYLVTGLFLLLSRAVGVSMRSMVLALGVVGLVWNVIFPEMACGLFIEYWALFGFGVLVFYRLCRMTNPVHRRMVDIALLVILAASVYLRWFAGIAWNADAAGLTREVRVETRVVYQELVIAAGFALFLIATRRFNQAISSAKLYRPLAALGHITFSLYLIHQFNLKLAGSVVTRVLNLVHVPATGPENAPTWYLFVLQIAFHIALASVFWYFCERPFLNKSLPPVKIDPSAPPKQASA